jgi:predicted DNA-binding transcriptional regulator AlpA
MTSQDPLQIPPALQLLAYLNLKTVEALTGYKHASIYDMMNKGTFPKCYVLGPQKRAWKRAEIEAWLDSRPQSHRGGE